MGEHVGKRTLGVGAHDLEQDRAQVDGREVGEALRQTGAPASRSTRLRSSDTG